MYRLNALNTWIIWTVTFIGRDSGLCSMFCLGLLKDFKKHSNKFEKIVFHDGQAHCLFDGNLLVRNGRVGVPSAKVLRGQQMSSLQMCDYLWLSYITHRRKIFL